MKDLLCESLMADIVMMLHKTTGVPMQFELTEEQAMIRQLAHDFARQEIAPLAAQADRDQRFHLPLQQQALELGLLNMSVGRESCENLGKIT